MAKTPAARAAEVKAPAKLPAKLPSKATKVQIREPEIKVDASKTNPTAARPNMPAKAAADPSMRQLFTSTLISASSWDYFASAPSNSLKVCMYLCMSVLNQASVSVGKT
jgi:hypothetical protein